MKKLLCCAMLVAAVLGMPMCVQAQTTTQASYTFYQKGNVYSPIAQKTRVLAPFGQQRQGYTHQGIDVATAMYTPVYAIADGIVTKASPDSKGIDKGGGNIIFIDHEDGTQSWYMHLSVYNVKVGDRVRAGDLIALTGDTGELTTPHLHFEYRVNNVPVDPYFIFDTFGLFDSITTVVSPVVDQEDFTAWQG